MWRRPAAHAAPPAQLAQVALEPTAAVPTPSLALGALQGDASGGLSEPATVWPRVAVGPVKGLGCRGGKRRARDACDRPAAALDAFSRAVAATQECASAGSRPSRVEYTLRYEWARGHATLEARSVRGSASLLAAERGHCIANIREYFLKTAPQDALHAAAEYRWSLVADYMKYPSKTP